MNEKKLFLSNVACEKYLTMFKKKRTIIRDIIFPKSEKIPKPKKVQKVEKVVKNAETKKVEEIGDIELIEELVDRMWEKVFKDPFNKVMNESYNLLLKKCVKSVDGYTEAQIACIIEARNANEAELCLEMRNQSLKRHYQKLYDKMDFKEQGDF